jgi:hypothetical protein
MFFLFPTAIIIGGIFWIIFILEKRDQRRDNDTFLVNTTAIALTRKAKKAAKYVERKSRKQAKSVDSSSVALISRLSSTITWIIGTPLAMLVFVYTIFGPPWPVDPEIHAHDVNNDSSLLLHFTLVNKSGIFGMYDVHFTCGVDLVYARDALGQAVVIRDVAFATGQYSVVGIIPLNYPCDASDLLQIRPDGSLSLHGSTTALQSNKETRYVAPWHIIKMCIWIGGDYHVAGLIPWRFRSAIFQWPAAPGSKQWIEGPIAREPPKDEQIPGFIPNALQCSNSIQYPYGLVSGPGRMYLIFE